MPMFEGREYDFSKRTPEQLKKTLKFHDEDRGCMTMAEEMRRMWFVQEIGAELQGRGINPWP